MAVSELEGEGGENGPEIAPVVEISRTEEARSELPICEAHLRKCLGDSRLPSPGEAVEPEHMFILFVIQPALKLEEDVSPGTLHASLPIPGEMTSVCSMMHPLEKSEARSALFWGYYT